MKWTASLWLMIAITFRSLTCAPQSQCLNEEEVRLEEFLAVSEEQLRNASQTMSFISWNYAININNETEKKKLDFQKAYNDLAVSIGTEARKFNQDQIHDFKLKRKLGWIRDSGSSVLSTEKRARYREIFNIVSKMYNVGKVPKIDEPQKMLSLEPDLVEIMGNSRDPDELEYYWTQWRDATGKKMRDLYLEHFPIRAETAQLYGYKDATEMLVKSYESQNFVQEMAETWNGLKPLYEQLHAYVRSKLFDKYGPQVIDPKGPIPAHLLGNMWAQTWSKLWDLLNPYPEKPGIDVTKAMVDQGWTPIKMFRKAEDFFVSLGFDPLPESFWRDSLIEKPQDGRDLICHASAWDFSNGKDFRIKQCTKVASEDFVTVHHEMGHTIYQRSYSNQSYLFRASANRGFHEGTGDTISLAVGSASHYKKLGLIDPNIDINDYETNINILMLKAAQKIAFLPFGYLMDKYKWDFYSNLASLDDLNCHWVKLRLEIQGVVPPNLRTEDDFDAGGKYHIASGGGYIHYFTAYIYQFQFYKSLCIASGEYDPNNPQKPLHNCNFYGNKVAGEKLKKMLSYGRSRPWQEVMEEMTGTPKMDTGPLREYFAPLEKWLIKYNKEKNNKVGWTIPDLKTVCSPKQTTSHSTPTASTVTTSSSKYVTNLGVRHLGFLDSGVAEVLKLLVTLLI